MSCSDQKLKLELVKSTVLWRSVLATRWHHRPELGRGGSVSMTDISMVGPVRFKLHCFSEPKNHDLEGLLYYFMVDFLPTFFSLPDHWLSILWKLNIQLNLTIFYVFFCETERHLDIPIFWLPTFYGGKVIGNKYYKPGTAHNLFRSIWKSLNLCNQLFLCRLKSAWNFR